MEKKKETPIFLKADLCPCNSYSPIEHAMEQSDKYTEADQRITRRKI